MSQPARSSVPGMDLPDLSELELSAPVSMVPETLAWKILFAAVVLMLLAYVLLRYRRYVRQRWRRQARALVVAARESASIRDWFALIKRVSMVHMTREQVAALGDNALLGQLTRLDDSARTALTEGHYRRQERLADEVNDAVASAFSQWLKELPDAG